MSRYLKLAVAQLGPIHLADTREAVVKRLIGMLRAAHADGCKLVVFPELALTTFFPRYVYHEQSEIDAWFEREMPNAATRPLFEEAKKLGVAFYLGYAELSEENGAIKRYNTAILVGPDGTIVGKYRKIHLPGHAEILPEVPFQHLEKRYFDVGDLGFPVWYLHDRIMGMCICNDRRWPETFRVMGLKGAELVMLGYNTPDMNIRKHEPVHLRMFHHMLTCQAAAYQNGIWLAVSAKAGKEDGYGMIGGSCIVAPTGEIATQAMSEDDEVISYNCDMELGEYIRQYQFNFEKHRRIEHYELITRQTGVIAAPENPPTRD
jgi:predicted amidohydrolase